VRVVLREGEQFDLQGRTTPEAGQQGREHGREHSGGREFSDKGQLTLSIRSGFAGITEFFQTFFQVAVIKF
jgi:hypothetical protein